MNKLALHGGDKAIKSSFKRYNSLGSEEVDAVNNVMQSAYYQNFKLLGMKIFMVH